MGLGGRRGLVGFIGGRFLEIVPCCAERLRLCAGRRRMRFRAGRSDAPCPSGFSAPDFLASTDQHIARRGFLGIRPQCAARLAQFAFTIMIRP